MKNIFVILAFSIAANCFSQALNAYEFLVIPAKFVFQKQPNQYGSQSLVESYFKLKGFNVINEVDGVQPVVANNRCRAMFVDVSEKSSMFATKLTVLIKDCTGSILAQSGEVVSNEKDYDVIYKQALRAALVSMPEQNYNYNGSAATTKVTDSSTKNPTASIPEPVVQQVSSAAVPNKSLSKYQVEVLSNGFLIINAQTAVVFAKLYKTSTPNVFIATKTNQIGVAIKNKTSLTLEFVVDNQLTTETLAIEF